MASQKEQFTTMLLNVAKAFKAVGNPNDKIRKQARASLEGLYKKQPVKADDCMHYVPIRTVTHVAAQTTQRLFFSGL